MEPSSLVLKAQEESALWLSINKKNLGRERNLSEDQNVSRGWVKPTSPFSKCNIGVSWIHSHRNSGTGWLLHDDKGHVLLHSRRSFSKPSSKLEAELSSIYWAVESLANLKWHIVILEISSEEARKAINNPSDWPIFRNILYDILRCLDIISEWQLN